MLEKILHKRPVIFLADDDDDDAFFLRAALREVEPEYDLCHFYNGKHLIDSLRRTVGDPPLFVVLDINMPVLDGLETLAIIRREISADLPVVILTTTNDPVTKITCINKGANYYFTKPYSFKRYLDILQEIKVHVTPHLEA